MALMFFGSSMTFFISACVPCLRNSKEYKAFWLDATRMIVPWGSGISNTRSGSIEKGKVISEEILNLSLFGTALEWMNIWNCLILIWDGSMINAANVSLRQFQMFIH